MELHNYRLHTQLGAGPDGTAYRAETLNAGVAVELCLLAGARASTDRWTKLARRLRLIGQLDHPRARRILEFLPEHQPPLIALELRPGVTLASAWQARLPVPECEVRELALELASLLGAAHRLGLCHGSLTADQIYLRPDKMIQVDFTRLQVGHPGGTAPVPDGERPEAPDQMSGDAADMYCLGLLLAWACGNQHPAKELASGQDAPFMRTMELPDSTPAPPALAPIITALLTADPTSRPSAADLLVMLRAPGDSFVQAGGDQVPADATLRMPGPGLATAEIVASVAASSLDSDVGAAPDPFLVRGRLGRYRLLKKLGEGGMGAVYQAEDTADGRLVAVKTLSTRMSSRSLALQRFGKEARLLAEVNHPNVTNLLDFNEDAGTLYLVIEYVAGQPLSDLMRSKPRLEEAEAIAIVADVARALDVAHQRGIVHRDIKPDNILLQESSGAASVAGDQKADAPTRYLVPKLSDFGLARHVEQAESLEITQAGTILGTPVYMSPEQCQSQPVGPPSDVYSLGATLFHMLAGRPPFVGETALALVAKHVREPAPPLRQFNTDVSDGLVQLVSKCLAKPPGSRYADAGVLLAELERLRRGEPSALAVHPRLPECDDRRVLRYDWTWDLDAAPAALWPYVSNTERLNRAAGVPAVEFTAAVDEAAPVTPDARPLVKRHGAFRKMGMSVRWREHPFEWVEGRRFGVLREYTDGPFKWFMSVVELEPRPEGGTRLCHSVRLEPHGLLGRTAAAIEIGVKGKRAVDRVYRRIDAAVMGKLGSRALADPFEEAAEVSQAGSERLEQRLSRLTQMGVDPHVVEVLGDFLAHAPAQEVARIRPLALAQRLGLDGEQVIAACLRGACEGLLTLLWDILCPLCRIPSEIKDTLKAVREHGRCEACQLDFELDFANAVELVFRAHPEIRNVELATYCIGGPVHSPHVAAQVRVAPRERLDLELSLAEGAYRFRGPQLPYVLDFRVQPQARLTRWQVDLARRQPIPDLRAGSQLLSIVNDYDQEIVIRIERTAARADALTAARASTHALFRELYPGEVLNPGQLVSVATLTFVATAVADVADLYEQQGDARAFAVLHEHFRLLAEHARREGGTLVKTVGEGTLSVFPHTVDAVRAGLALQSLLEPHPGASALKVCVGVHRGPAMAATLNDHLDYFGVTVNAVWQLVQLGSGGEVLLTDTVTGDPPVAALLAQRKLVGLLHTLDLPGQRGAIVQRFPQAPVNSP